MTRKPAKVGACKVDGAEAPLVARGMCRKHYVDWYRHREHGPRCGADGCKQPPYTNGLCPKHDYRIKRYGSHDDEVLVRKPTDGRRIESRGYVELKVPGHPAAFRKVWVFEHRVVMEQHLGRYLRPYENVHHINGVRHDNRLENLELWISKQPAGQRPADLVVWAHEILALYQDEVLLHGGGGNVHRHPINRTRSPRPSGGSAANAGLVGTGVDGGVVTSA